MQRYKNLAVLLIVLLIVITGGAIVLRKYFDGNTRERVKINNIDLSNIEPEEVGKKVPPNFPKDIPLQLTEVTESYEVEYPNRKVLISAITFKTFRTPQEIFELYKTTAVQIGYLVEEDNTDQEKGVLFVSKEGNYLMIVIGQEIEGKRSVQMVYTKNQ